MSTRTTVDAMGNSQSWSSIPLRPKNAKQRKRRKRSAPKWAVWPLPLLRCTLNWRRPSRKKLTCSPGLIDILRASQGCSVRSYPSLMSLTVYLLIQ